ncbi:MAG: hypothetical protein KJ950_10540 [Proteobacteria bacterium]|nr:hypothetical protein [Pseudomonadota bacterium]MBU1687499.1 hypothetical protein [Pseudomonadota bacterium]
MKIRMLFLMILVAGVFFWQAGAVAAESRCTEILGDTCLNCHGEEKFCPLLGKSLKFWKATLDLMEANGAELSKDEFALVAECLSLPAPEAKAFCKR